MKFLLLLLSFTISYVTAAQSCAGSPAYCSKRFDEMVFVSTHNAFNYKKGPTRFIWPNQKYPVKKQLADGVRNLMLDVYDINGTIYLYHANAKLGKEKLQLVLADIRAFLDTNKTEIVSIIFQNDITKNRIATELDTAGLTPYCHIQKLGEAWPTLAEMIAQNHRLVLFVESNTGTDVPYIHSAWDYIFDTPWNTKTVDEMGADVGRGKTTNSLFLLNNWISKGKPTKKKARLVNNQEFLGLRILHCAVTLRRIPNFLGVNFYSEGDAVKIAKMLNDGMGDRFFKIAEKSGWKWNDSKK